MNLVPFGPRNSSRAIAVASAAGKRSGATRYSVSSPIVFMARAAELMFPGCAVPTYSFPELIRAARTEVGKD